MIKKILIIVILLFSISLYGASRWKKVTSATYNPLSDIFFINENLGWIAGQSGTILRTTDGGYTWEEPIDTLPVIASMYSIFFVDENIGYAGGANDLILKSIDGGATWIEVMFESVGGKIYSLYFTDANTGWVLSGTSTGGEISHTTDGGTTWTIQATEVATNLKAMSFYSAERGVCVGGRSGNFAIYYTTDGLAWTKAPTPTGIPYGYTRTDLNAVVMINETVAFATGWGASSSGLQPTYTLRSTDGGANWTYETQVEDNRLYVNLYSIAFNDELYGIAVGGSSYKGGVAYKTIDGGLNWNEINFPMGFQAKSISLINDKICIVGSNGGIAISEDAGESWKLITEIPSSTLYEIDKIGDNTIIAAGFNGLFLKSIDNGESWESTYISDKNVSPTVEDLFFLNENIGYAAQKNRTVSKTSDGGETWTQIMKDTMATTINNYGVLFINEDVGFVVGKGNPDVSAFYKTTDGGINWSSLIADPNLINELNSLHFFDENNGVVAGDESALAYTTDGGISWTKITPSNMPPGEHDFYEIEFLNNSFGLAAGEKLILSNDGGKTWEYIEVAGLSKKIESIAIVDELTWYLTGSKFLFVTYDGGYTWEDIIDLDIVTATTNYGIMVDNNGYIWVASGGSEIYRAVPTVDVKLVDDNLVSKFSLEANYPNPFNPSTIIKYSIPVETRRPATAGPQNVTLKVYNLLGQVVATLVNEIQKPGAYEVVFNASKLASGIYIYTLTSAGLLQSRKMLLIK
ncbi:MAG: YCF48-related protein [Melioribacteraceae bacterium]|nr:YCF48-related protein [Melioribacteraceae bacterium]